MHGGSEPPGTSVSAYANAGASFSEYEVVFSGPSGQSTLASLDLLFDGYATIAVDIGIGSATVDIGATVVGPHGAATNGGGLATELSSQITTGSGLLSGWHGFPMNVSTSSFQVEAGDLVTVRLSLSGHAECSTVAFSRVSFCPASFRVPTFSFSTTGPVFELPAGWTANSLDGSIVNNTFIPEPSTALLLSAGLIGLALRRSS